MDILKLFLAATAAWILLQWWVVPHLHKSIPELITRENIPRIATSSAVEALTKLALLIAIALGLTNLVTAYVNSMDGVDVAQVKQVMDTIAEWRELFSGWSQGLGFFITAILALALVYTSYRSGQKSVEERWNKVFNEEFMRLASLKESGELEELPPSKEMEEVIVKMSEYDAVFEELEKDYPEEARKIQDIQSELLNYYHFLDIQRRVDVNLSSENDKEVPVWMRVVKPFISRGAITSASTGAVILSVILTLLLIPSFYSIAAPVLDDFAEQRIEVLNGKIETLQISINLEQAKVEYLGVVEDGAEEQSGQGSADSEWTKADQGVADALGAEFESNVMSDRVYGHATQTFSRAAARAIARQSILQARASVQGSNASVANGGSVSRTGAADNVVAEMQNTVPAERKPQTEIGRKYSEDMRRLAERKPDKWQAISGKAKNYFSSFNEVPAPRQIKGMLLSNSLGNLMGAANVDNAFGKVATEVVSDISGETAKKIYEAESKRFTSRMISEPTLEAAMRSGGNVEPPLFRAERVRGMNYYSESFPNMQHLSDSWVDSPPSYQRAANQAGNTQRAVGTLDRYAQVVGRSGMQRGGTDVLARFADYFPGYDGADTKTLQAKVNNKYTSSSSSSRRVVSASSSTRARSFFRLRGFARVGGVLIGRPPENEEAVLAIDAVEWQWLGENQIKLQLVSGANRHDLGVYDPELVALALAYAADGRPTTVTMVTAQPLRELKILLHPTLEDSGLGCLAIRLDQLVDEVVGNSSSLEKLREQTLGNVTAQHALYSYSWAVRAAVLTAPMSPVTSGLVAQVGLGEVLLDWIDSYSSSGEKYIAETLGSSPAARDFMRKKSAYYHLPLVDAIDACIASEDAASYTSCIFKKSMAQSSQYDSRLRWAAPPPQYQPWSGVREMDYVVDNTLSFLKKSGADALYPLDFTYQISFTTPPFLVKSEKPWYVENMDVDNYFDANPYEFKTFKAKISQELKKSYQKNSEHRKVLSSMKQFVILQRIFRLGLDGHYGEGFRTGSLAELAKETSRFIQTVPTRRWLSKAGAIEAVYVNSFGEYIGKMPQPENARKVLSSCLELVVGVTNSIELASISSDAWDKQCLYDVDTVGEEFSKFSQQVSLIRQLRFDMGVVAEDAAWSLGMSCSRSY